LVKRLRDEAERENQSATEATLATKGALRSHKSLLSRPDNHAFDGFLESPAAMGPTNPHPQLAAAGSTTETTEGGIFAASDGPTRGYIAAAVDGATEAPLATKGGELFTVLSDSHDTLDAARPSEVSVWGDGEEERAAIVEFGAGVPRAWAEGFARLHPDRPPPGVPRGRWQVFVDDAGRFLDTWATEAAASGWTAVEVFGCDRDRPWQRLDQMGLAWLIAGGRVVSISMSAAVIQTFRRKVGAPGRVLVWELFDEGRPS
jgi:hypothetical protein